MKQILLFTMLDQRKINEKLKLFSSQNKVRNSKKHTKAILIDDLTFGVDQEVKAVQCDNSEKYVIKFPLRQPQKIMHEIIGCNKAHLKGVPVPEVIYYDNQCLLQTFIAGQRLSKCRESSNKYRKIYKFLGQSLKKIHLNPGKGYGKIDLKSSKKILRGENFSVQKIKNSILQEIKILGDKDFYSQNLIKYIKNYSQQATYLLQTMSKPNQTCLLHGDYSEDNIIVNKGQVRAIIDFGDLSIGDPMEDFARIFVAHVGTYKFDQFLSGYGQHNLDLIKVYAFWLCLWQINGLIEAKKHRGRFRQLEKALKIIIR